MRKIVSPWWILVLLAVAAVAPAEARKGKKASTEPGKYSEWRDEIDELEIHGSVDLSAFDRIVVADFETGGVELPEKDDNTYEPVQQVLREIAGPLAEGLGEEISKSVETGAAASGALVVEGSVIEIDPGSRAARYWGGFGAGAARVKLRIRVRSGSSGEVLFEMTQERRSGVGMGGGDYVNLLNRNLRKIGEDVAFVLNAF